MIRCVDCFMWSDILAIDRGTARAKNFQASCKCGYELASGKAVLIQ